MTREVPYNDKLDPDEQIAVEEAIAVHLFDTQPSGYDGLSEEDAAQYGRDILYMVLRRFRPDLFKRR